MNFVLFRNQLTYCSVALAVFAALERVEHFGKNEYESEDMTSSGVDDDEMLEILERHCNHARHAGT